MFLLYSQSASSSIILTSYWLCCCFWCCTSANLDLCFIFLPFVIAICWGHTHLVCSHTEGFTPYSCAWKFGCNALNHSGRTPLTPWGGGQCAKYNLWLLHTCKTDARPLTTVPHPWALHSIFFGSVLTFVLLLMVLRAYFWVYHQESLFAESGRSYGYLRSNHVWLCTQQVCCPPFSSFLCCYFF